MSTDEQDLLLGRLTRQSAECGRSIAALEVRLSGFIQALSHGASHLQGMISPNPLAAVEQAIAALSDLPEREEIAATLQELESERKRETQIRDLLAAMRP